MYCLKKRVWIGRDASGVWHVIVPRTFLRAVQVLSSRGEAGGTFLFRGWWSLWATLAVRWTSVVIQSDK